MEDSSTDLLEPRANEGAFVFAFNDIDFSDRILHLEIMPLAPNRKPIGEKYLKWLDHSNCSEFGTDFKVKTFHISSPILASKSNYFYKLFKIGMRKQQQKDDVTLRINELAFMDLLNFIYGDTLSATSVPDLLDVLMTANKFGVTSCMRYCILLLLKLPMSLEHAIFYFELPARACMSEIVQPLIDVAKQYVVEHYMDFTNKSSQEKTMHLPLSALEVVLKSDGLRVNTEDDVFDFILKWACVHYPELEERREILTKRLARVICFPHMTCSKLKEVLVCQDFDHEEVSKLVLEALFSKVEVPYGQHIQTSKDLTTTKCNFPRRVYNQGIIKVVQLEFPTPHCVVYFDLKRDECENLFRKTRLYSQSFGLGRRLFYLSAQCLKKNDQNSLHHFGLFVHLEKSSITRTIIDYELAVIEKSSNDFQGKFKGRDSIVPGYGKGKWNLFGIPWSDFMSTNCEYFIDGVLHLRVELTINNSQD